MSTTRFLSPVLALLLLGPLACSGQEQGAGEANDSSQATAEAESNADKAADTNATAGEQDARQRIRERLREERPDVEIASVRETPVDGIYEIVSGGEVYYITPDARYLFSGNLVDLESGRNITQARRSALAHDIVEELDRDRMVVFEPANGPAENHITVFTDTTCGYCRRLHEEVLSLVEEYPVEVRYAMFPRAGRNSPAADTLRNVWCADDPASALTRAKQGQSIEAPEGRCDTPMEEHLAAAGRIGVRGTPYMVIGDDGPVVPGYRPKRQLLSMLGLESKE